MFFKKKPTVTSNNQLRDTACQELNTAIFKIKTGEHNSAFSEEKVKEWAKDLETLSSVLANCTCTGKEDLQIVADAITEDIRNISNAMHSTLATKVDREIGVLQKHVMIWKNVNDGRILAKDVIPDIQGDRSNRAVFEKLEEFHKCKDIFDSEARRLSEEKANNINDLKELEDQMAEAVDNDTINSIDSSMTELEDQNMLLSATIDQIKNVSSMLGTIRTYVESRVKLNKFSEKSKSELLTYLDTSKINIDDPKYTAALVSHIYTNIQKVQENTVAPTPPPKPVVKKPVNHDAMNGTTLNESAEARKKAILEKREAKRIAEEAKNELDNDIDVQASESKNEVK